MRTLICSTCKLPKASEGHLLRCKSVDPGTIRDRSSYRMRVANGRCAGHPSRTSITTGKCEECFFRAVALANLGSGKLHWRFLKDLLKAQNYRCAYTGRKLQPGKGCSIDHIRPTARGGSQTRKNVQWVAFEVNRVKSYLTHKEFLAVCRLNSRTRGQDAHSVIFRSVWAYQVEKNRKAAQDDDN